MAGKSLISSKRGPPAPLSGPSSSSSEGEGSDHEDYIPPSPCSSTASEPTYERLPGFTHHGQEVVAPKAPKPRINGTTKLKKRVKRYPLGNGGTLGNPPQQPEDERTSNAAPNKLKHKKDPLPMKLRALPQSFWQQPNSVNTMSPGNIYLPVLPPLCKSEHSNVDPSEIRPLTPTSDGEEEKPQIEDHNYSTPEGYQPQKMSCLNVNNNSSTVRDRNGRDPVAMEMMTAGKSPRSPRDRGLFPASNETQETPSPVVVRRKVHHIHPGRPPPRIVKVSPASQELLMKLFEGVDRGEKGTKKIPGAGGPRKIRPPRQDPKIAMATTNKHLIKDQYMISAVTDGLLPMLSLETSKQSTAPPSQLSLVALKAGDKTLTLPSLSVDQNYPAVLSELVKAL